MLFIKQNDKIKELNNTINYNYGNVKRRWRRC